MDGLKNSRDSFYLTWMFQNVSHELFSSREVLKYLPDISYVNELQHHNIQPIYSSITYIHRTCLPLPQPPYPLDSTSCAGGLQRDRHQLGQRHQQAELLRGAGCAFIFFFSTIYFSDSEFRFMKIRTKKILNFFLFNFLCVVCFCFIIFNNKQMETR